MGMHTRGPWLRDTMSGMSCDVRAASGRKIALCWGLSTTKAANQNTAAYRAECDANARLIAASATSYDKHCGARAIECAEEDLLGELAAALNGLLTAPWADFTDDETNMQPELLAARAAVAKLGA